MPPDAPLIDELCQLLCETLRLPEPTPPVAADEPLFGGRLNLDSVDSLQWAAAVERHFQFELSDEEIFSGALHTLGKMAQVLTSRGHRNDVFCVAGPTNEKDS